MSIFGFQLGEIYGCRPENLGHGHSPEERAELFAAIDGGTAELETLNFLNACVYLTKPHNVLETGTGSGISTIAIACALQQNGFGRVHSVEIEVGEQVRAAQRIAKFSSGLVDYVTLHLKDSLQFIREWSGPPFDFCFFDSLIAFRHEEFALLLERGLLTSDCMCIFHDTSRLRGQYMPDFNPTMIEALDRASTGRQWLEFPLSRGLRVIRLG